MFVLMWKSSLLLSFVLASPYGAASEAQFSKYQGETTSLISGSLGIVDPNILNSVQKPGAAKAEAAKALMAILRKTMGFTGEEDIRPTEQRPGVDAQGNVHIRFKQYLNGLPIEGASIALHIDGSNGKAFAVNGELHSTDAIVPSQDKLDCKTAVTLALEEHGITNGEWESGCEDAAVQGRDGKAYFAYKRLREFQPESGGPIQRVVIFASRSTGALLAAHPKVYTDRPLLKTYDCLGLEVDDLGYCALISSSSNKLETHDDAVNDAHNFAIEAYSFFRAYFGRDSMDHQHMVLTSLAHYGENFDNAFFTADIAGGVLAYGDGDGIHHTFWSKAFDIVMHEYSHGVTYFTSKLVYNDESGALNEAFSDIMAAAADRMSKGKAPSDAWLIGEDMDTYSADGAALRDMKNPGNYNLPDHYSVRYIGNLDYGGVHINSAIMNLAFVLMVEGGTHPRSGILVPALNPNFDLSLWEALQIAYVANTMWFTESSDLLVAREVMILIAGNSQKDSVTKAWDAVGVRAVLPLSERVKVTGLALTDGEVQVYQLVQPVPVGLQLSCSLVGNNGNADLFVRFGKHPLVTPPRDTNSCSSQEYDSVEQCTTSKTTAVQTAYIAVQATSGFNDLTLECHFLGAVLSLKEGEPVTGLYLSKGEVQVYELVEKVPAGRQLSCSLVGNNGNADLFVRFGKHPQVTPPLNSNSCWSQTYNSVDQCTTSKAGVVETAYIAVLATSGFDDLAVECHLVGCKTRGSLCSSRSECCTSDLTCDKGWCKTCLRQFKPCRRDAQCCGGHCKNRRCK